MAEGTVTSMMLKNRSGEFDLESIHTVSLADEDLHDLGCIGECTNLERLDLSYNSFSKLHRLASLENLQYLNLSANRITSLEGLQALNNLEKINVAGNLIGGVCELRCLAGLEKLVSVRLQDSSKGLSNPVCMNSSYLADVSSMLPALLSLDGERIKGRGSEVFKMMRDVDQALAVRSGTCEDTGPRVEPWVPSDYWEPNKAFEQTMLGDAQQQLEGAQVHTLDNTSMRFQVCSKNAIEIYCFPVKECRVKLMRN